MLWLRDLYVACAAMLGELMRSRFYSVSFGDPTTAGLPPACHTVSDCCDSGPRKIAERLLTGGRIACCMHGKPGGCVMPLTVARRCQPQNVPLAHSPCAGWYCS